VLLPKQKFIQGSACTFTVFTQTPHEFFFLYSFRLVSPRYESGHSLPTVTRSADLYSPWNNIHSDAHDVLERSDMQHSLYGGGTMCGRFVMMCDLSEIIEAFDISDRACEPKPSYNIAPGTEIAAIIHAEVNRLVPFIWGLLPAWSKDPSICGRLINARAETVTEKPSFRSALKRRRCLIVATGFYEWKKNAQGNMPFYIGLRTDAPFGFAGLYETRQFPDGRELSTCAIITTEANELIKPIHHRMPVIIPQQEEERWLDPSPGDTKALLPLLQPYPSEAMKAYRVSPLVNAPRNNSAACVKPFLNNDHYRTPEDPVK